MLYAFDNMSVGSSVTMSDENENEMKTPTALGTSRFRKLKGDGGSSPCCGSILEKSMVCLSKRAGVPV